MHSVYKTISWYGVTRLAMFTIFAISPPPSRLCERIPRIVIQTLGQGVASFQLSVWYVGLTYRTR
ncbi:hypothetical protein P152DRAFT_310688 [Eremomyces bilateralis CBS 781.70]|uniref:Uncharacterized protein n=1 Tax=Eremomyces bilateralis CBS 781.70 TaxID=1392243 RepID=A0A6G1G5L2_9PEZI|nr:uncharacterized protein P152DRAFT_310688 [Eremomyces bilateralis CBS 781.70]KAF1813231.1 hypothetical protein P152DRAFT_310688 [Eremomyces bilateralis CBS 781.70]